MARGTDVDIILRAQLALLQGDLAKANTLITGFAQKTTAQSAGHFRQLSNAIKGAFGANLGRFGGAGGIGLAVGAAAAGFTLATKRALDFSSEIVDTARNLGLTTDALQEMRFAATQSGVSVEALDRALGFMNTNLSRAQSSRTASEPFRRLGIDVKELIRTTDTADERFVKIARSIGALSSVADQTNIARKIFGRGGLEIVKITTDGIDAFQALRAEAHELGIVIDEEMLKSAEKAGDKFEALSHILKTQAVAALVEMAPILVQVGEALLKGAKGAGEFFDQFRDPENATSINGMKAGLDSLQQKLQNLRDQKAFFTSDDPMKQALGSLDFMSEKDPAKLDATIALVQEDIARLTERLNAATEAKNKLDEALSTGLDNLPTKLGAADSDEKARLKELAAERKAALQLRKDTAELAKSEAAMLDSQLAAADLALETQERRLEAEAEFLEAIGKTTEAQQKRAELADINYKKETANIKRVITNRDQQEAVLAEAAAAHSAEMKKVAEEANESFKNLKDFGIRGISSALADLVTTGKLTFADLAQSFIHEFIEVAIENGVKKLAASLASLGGASTGGGWLGTALSFFTAAEGAVISKPSLVMAGEHGAEAIVPLSQWGKLGSGGGGIVVNIIEAPGTSATVSTKKTPSGTRLDVQIRNIVATDFAAGGPVSRSAARAFGLSRKGDPVG